MWNEVNAVQCLSAYGKKPERILVVGCGNKGEDIKAFNTLLSSNVIIHGVDVIDDIGCDYQAENVMYIKCDATNLSIMSEYYDLAYSFATFEHIKNIQSAWQHMLRVLRKGGMLYTVAAPLWMSPYGHHKKNIFDGFPYVHLKYPTSSKLSDFCASQGINKFDDIDIIHHINYMFSDEYFNKHDSQYYIDSAKELKFCTLIKNSLDYILDYEMTGYECLIKKGFKEQDLFSITHRLIALKN